MEERAEDGGGDRGRGRLLFARTAAHRGPSAAGAECLKLSSTVSQGSEAHEDQHWVGNTRGSRRHRHWDSQQRMKIETSRYHIYNQPIYWTAVTPGA
jgi:hypothetical protein